MKFFSEFKEFAVKGNMVDIAIGVIIGASFESVIDVIVKKVMLPPLSLLTGGINFSGKKLVLRNAIESQQIEEVSIGYGELFEAFIDFFIVAFVVFLVVRIMNTLKKKSEDSTNETVATPRNIELMTEMNNLLKEQNELLKAKK